jgi:hypothetical protein
VSPMSLVQLLSNMSRSGKLFQSSFIKWFLTLEGVKGLEVPSLVKLDST